METRKIELGNPIREGKIIINGQTRIGKIYRVNIKSLYYNDENGRIATFIMKYESEHSKNIKSLDFDEYNDTIMKFIKDSGSSTNYRKTKEDIKEHGQLKTGIILEDGRVIDGNRRFTCLRELYQENPDEKYLYFECFVIPVPKTREDKTIIKSLELNYQFGEDQREDYDPIDKLVDTYIYLVNPKTKMFTPEEYRARTNNMIKLNEIKFRMLKAKTLYDYLDFIGYPNRFDIARDFKLDGPIQELAIKRKKLGEDSDEWNRIAPVLFTQMRYMGGDRAREIRKLLKIYDNEPNKFDSIAEEVFKISMKDENLSSFAYDSVTEKEKKREIQQDLARLDNTINRAHAVVSRNQARDKQIKILEDVLGKLDSIDNIALRLSNEEEKLKMLNEINQIESKIKRIKEVIGNVNKI